MILIVTGLIAFYLLTAFCLSRITINKDVKTSDDVTIYIKTNGVHTDLVVPVKHPGMDWSNQVKYSHTVLNDSTMKWLAFGWGDKGFYLQTPTWADLKFSVAFNATFGLSTTAIHATFYKSLTESETCKRINISEEQYKALTKYLLDSFQKDSTGQVKYINTTANYSNTDAFYEATGKYSLFKTCNTWANTGLKISGQKCCFWTAFDKAIFLKYQ